MALGNISRNKFWFLRKEFELTHFSGRSCVGKQPIYSLSPDQVNILTLLSVSVSLLVRV